MPYSYKGEPHLDGVPAGARNKKGYSPRGRSTGDLNSRSRNGSTKAPIANNSSMELHKGPNDPIAARWQGGRDGATIKGSWKSWRAL